MPLPLQSPPRDLETDLRADSSVASEVLDDLDSCVSHSSVLTADQEGSDDLQHIAEGAGPIRSKATFHSAGVRLALLDR